MKSNKTIMMKSKLVQGLLSLPTDWNFYFLKESYRLELINIKTKNLTKELCGWLLNSGKSPQGLHPLNLKLIFLIKILLDNKEHLLGCSAQVFLLLSAY